ncbi:MAG: DMT family transporter [Muribaculaceae bacterium]|nr:DMT family transporter [Muribaculaceae bacterium]
MGKLLYHIIAMLMVVVWGLSFPSTRILLDAGLSPAEIFVYRFSLAYVLLALLTLKSIKIYPLRNEMFMALCGIMGGSLFFLAQNIALNLTLMSDVAVLVAINPLLTTMLAAIFLREEHFTWVQAAGSVVAFAGVALLTFHDGFVWGHGVLGDILALIAALSWAAYSVVLKRLNGRYSATVITRKTFFYGAITAAPLLLIPGQASASEVLMQSNVVAHLLYLSVVCSLIAFFLWSVTTKHIGAISATNYLYLNPLVSMIAAAILYDERVGIWGYLGCALILTGIIVVNYKQREKVKSEQNRP